MAKIVNTNEEILFASDQECIDRRKQLIEFGIITPADNSEFIIRRDGNVVMPTKENSKNERKNLIDCGIINIELYKLLPEKNRPLCTQEEGEYKCHPIKTEEEYLRRKHAYFRMIQEILFSRRDLNIIFGKKENNNPSWYF
ncbi:MAG: hypothetical protein WC516_04890 [Patescibacteria group bacterium]